MTGVVTRVLLPKGYGFVQGDDGREYLVHAAQNPDLVWDGEHIKKGVKLDFSPLSNGARWRAVNSVVVAP